MIFIVASYISTSLLIKLQDYFLALESSQSSATGFNRWPTNHILRLESYGAMFVVMMMLSFGNKPRIELNTVLNTCTNIILQNLLVVMTARPLTLLVRIMMTSSFDFLAGLQERLS